LKLNKLIAAEIVVAALALISLVVFVDFTPYLGSSSQNNKIGLYSEKEYAKGNVTVVPGGKTFVQFSYSSYEPAILVLELTFQSWDSSGYVNIRLNNKPIPPIFASPENPIITLYVVSASGAEWVEPLSSMFGLNEVTFESGFADGFKGILGYRIRLRGSR
jgi:hypothetical protein